MIDHAVLHPTLTREQLIAGCELAGNYGVASVCIKPYAVKLASDILDKSTVATCTVIGFPHGGNSTDIKEAETLHAIKEGATEIDAVINIGKALDKDWIYIKNEIACINSLCVDNGALLKVIFETDFITEDPIKIRLCEICNDIGVAFVKTSTGFGMTKQTDGHYAYTGATVHDVALMKEHCVPEIQIKASGNIKTLADVLTFAKIGATRIGTSSTVAILEEAASHA